MSYIPAVTERKVRCGRVAERIFEIHNEVNKAVSLHVERIMTGYNVDEELAVLKTTLAKAVEVGMQEARAVMERERL